jgi:hypothetical protein
MPNFELQLKERICQFFEEHPGVVPDLFEFIEWLYDILFWEDVAKRDELVKEGKRNEYRRIF